MIISLSGIELIQHFESCKLTAYKDSGGVMTIGWGHTGSVINGQMITQAEADRLLGEDLRTISAGVTAAIGHGQAAQHHFDAFVSLAFNVGVSAFAGSTLLKRYLTGQDCALEFLRWCLDGGKVMPGLALRRMAERMMFLGRKWQQVV